MEDFAVFSHKWGGLTGGWVLKPAPLANIVMLREGGIAVLKSTVRVGLMVRVASCEGDMGAKTSAGGTRQEHTQ